MENREIKFRAWYKGKFIFGSLLDYKSSYTLVVTEDLETEYFDNVTCVGQYTGRKDLEDKEVYEDDIMIKDGNKFVIKWNNKKACYVGWEDLPIYYWFNQSKIIGNIHQNPELK